MTTTDTTAYTPHLTQDHGVTAACSCGTTTRHQWVTDCPATVQAEDGYSEVTIHSYGNELEISREDAWMLAQNILATLDATTYQFDRFK